MHFARRASDKGETDMAGVAVVAHSRKSFGGGLPELRRTGW
jgi:hypothetical protein